MICFLISDAHYCQYEWKKKNGGKRRLNLFFRLFFLINLRTYVAGKVNTGKNDFTVVCIYNDFNNIHRWQKMLPKGRYKPLPSYRQRVYPCPHLMTAHSQRRKDSNCTVNIEVTI